MSNYPESMAMPMRQDLTEAGFVELKTPSAVDAVFEQETGTTLLVVNSVCGCAASNARPGVKMALSHSEKQPTNLVTVFAGMEPDAVNQARSYMLPYPPSSPAIALFKNGSLVHILERHNIEGRPAQMIADNLADAFNEYC